MKIRFSGLFLLCAGLFALRATAQTTVVAVPESDTHGYLVFRISRVIRVEGSWKHPLAVGSLIYPQIPTLAYPLGRFGEAAIIAFPCPNDVYSWQGVYVHNGYIPALNACAAKTFIRQLEQKADGPRALGDSSGRRQSDALRECPICHRVHLRTQGT